MKGMKVGVMLFAAALTVTALVSTASAAESQTVGIRPVSGDWFRLDVAPGESVEHEFLVQNRTAQQAHVLMYPVDAFVTPQGGFALRERLDSRTGVGSWTSVGSQALTLAPNGQSRLRFRLTVPKTAEPGDYAGGIVVERDPRLGSTSTVGSNLAVQFNIVERVGVRIYLHVNGIPTKALTTGRLTWTRTEQGIEFRLPIHNSGNVRLAPRGSVNVHGLGTGDRTISFTFPELMLPGSDYTMTGEWRDPAAFVWGSADATVEFGGERAAETTTAVHVVPLLMLGALLAVLLLLGVVLRLVVRFVRRARRALKVVDAPVVVPHPVMERVPEPVITSESRDPNLAWLDYATNFDGHVDPDAAASG